MNQSNQRARRGVLASALVTVAAALVALLVGVGGAETATQDHQLRLARTGCLKAFEGCVDMKNPVVAAAMKRLNSYVGSHRITKWPGPTSSPPVAKDKYLVLIPCSAAAAGCTAQTRGAAEAAKALGWRTLTIDGQGSAKVYDQAIRQAINTKADGVFLVAIADNLAGPAIRDARKAGLAVVSFGTENVPKPNGVNWEESIHYDLGGVAMGNFLIAYTNGEGRFAIVNGPEFPSVTKYLKGVRDTINKHCKGCKIVTETNVAVTELGTTAGPRAVAMLRAHPDVQVVVAPYDPAGNAMIAAVRQANLDRNVKFVGSNGDPPNLKIVRDDDIQVADLSVPFIWGGWAAVDTFNRIFTGSRLIDENFPTRLFTVWDKQIIPTKDYWNGDFDFRAQYKKLWKVK
jgi:ribose transport system substrate-binding protein